MKKQKNEFDILNSWNDVKLVCIHNHDVPVEMEIKKGPSSLFYACPKYDMGKLKKGETRCNNRLNLVDCTSMLTHLHSLIVSAELDDEMINLKNVEWKTIKGIVFKVLSHEGDSIVVGVENKRAIRMV